jgi:purine-cytosine permease-like protein
MLFLSFVELLAGFLRLLSLFISTLFTIKIVDFFNWEKKRYQKVKIKKMEK